MNPPVATAFFFYLLAAVMIIGGVMVITRKNAVHSALALITTLLGVLPGLGGPEDGSEDRTPAVTVRGPPARAGPAASAGNASTTVVGSQPTAGPVWSSSASSSRGSGRLPGSLARHLSTRGLTWAGT